MKSDKNLTFEIVNKTNWNKLEYLFGDKGACGNCWCMYFRLPKSDFAEGKSNDGNKLALKELAITNKPIGMLAVYEGEPIGWCAFAPRTDYLKLSKSRVHKPIDDKPVWSITCFFIAKKFRQMAISLALLKAIVKYAKTNKIEILEAYPTIPTTERLPDAFAWIGLYKTFEKAGFKIVDQTSKNRPMVRYYL